MQMIKRLHDIAILFEEGKAGLCRLQLLLCQFAKDRVCMTQINTGSKLLNESC